MKVVDDDVLLNLKDFLGTEDFQKIIQLFDISIKEIQQKLEDSSESLSLDEVRRVAHKMKSTSGTIGANQLSLYCKELESILDPKQAKDLKDRLQILVILALQAKAEIDLWMKSVGF